MWRACSGVEIAVPPHTPYPVFPCSVVPPDHGSVVVLTYAMIEVYLFLANFFLSDGVQPEIVRKNAISFL